MTKFNKCNHIPFLYAFPIPPDGPTGSTGTGPTGPTGLNPIQSHGFFFNSVPTTVAVGSNIPFASGSSNVLNMSIDVTNVIITLDNTGVYLVSYSVNLNTGSATSMLQAFQNGIAIGSTNIAIPDSSVGSQVFLITATSGDTIEIRNVGTAILTLNNSGTNPSITIVQIG
ncbi:hypothetical protein OCA16_19555 [Bacillus cereus]|nr:hypothetical protein [Bacillus cereus]